MCKKSADFLFEKSVLIHTKQFLTPIFMSGAVGGRRGPSVRKIVWCELGFKGTSQIIIHILIINNCNICYFDIPEELSIRYNSTLILTFYITRKQHPGY